MDRERNISNFVLRLMINLSLPCSAISHHALYTSHFQLEIKSRLPFCWLGPISLGVFKASALLLMHKLFWAFCLLWNKFWATYYQRSRQNLFGKWSRFQGFSQAPWFLQSVLSPTPLFAVIWDTLDTLFLSSSLSLYLWIWQYPSFLDQSFLK